METKEYQDLRISIIKRIKFLTKKVNKENKEIYQLSEKLKEICLCELINLEHKEICHEGSYFDTTYYEHYDICKICGKRYNETIVRTNQYG